jgi:hypothetical protein
VLKVDDGRYTVPAIKELVELGGPLRDDSDLGQLFHLVYVKIPHRMKSSLRPDTNRDITMKEYFKEFPVTLEALILMMFQTIPEYLIGEKENQNRLTKELEGARRVSLQPMTDRGEPSSNVNQDPQEETPLPKKKGGRPANKEGFVLTVFDNYRKEVDTRRLFDYQPSEKDQPEAYKEWAKRRDNGEFAGPKKFYERALAALNQKNQEARKRTFATAAITSAAASCESDSNITDDDEPKVIPNYDDRAAEKYKKVHGDKRKFEQTMDDDQLAEMVNSYVENPENVEMNNDEF